MRDAKHIALILDAQSRLTDATRDLANFAMRMAKLTRIIGNKLKLESYKKASDTAQSFETVLLEDLELEFRDRRHKEFYSLGERRMRNKCGIHSMKKLARSAAKKLDSGELKVSGKLLYLIKVFILRCPQYEAYMLHFRKCCKYHSDVLSYIARCERAVTAANTTVTQAQADTIAKTEEQTGETNVRPLITFRKRRRPLGQMPDQRDGHR